MYWMVSEMAKSAEPAKQERGRASSGLGEKLPGTELAPPRAPTSGQKTSIIFTGQYQVALKDDDSFTLPDEIVRHQISSLKGYFANIRDYGGSHIIFAPPSHWAKLKHSSKAQIFTCNVIDNKVQLPKKLANVYREILENGQFTICGEGDCFVLLRTSAWESFQQRAINNNAFDDMPR